MSTTKVPGICAVHAVITPNCRTVPRPEHDADPALAAFDEAAARLRLDYAGICRHRGDAWVGHLVLTMEKPES